PARERSSYRRLHHRASYRPHPGTGDLMAQLRAQVVRKGKAPGLASERSNSVATYPTTTPTPTPAPGPNTAATSITPAPTANPGPLGLFGLALTTFVLSISNAGLLPGRSDVLVVLGPALFYGGIALLLAGMWEFRVSNTFAATAFTSYGAFWLSFAALFLPGFGAAAGVVSSQALGVYLLAWTVFTGLLMLSALRA